VLYSLHVRAMHPDIDWELFILIFDKVLSIIYIYNFLKEDQGWHALA
jgi:hypothetical protein